MSMKEWAKNEIELAIKKENPDWDGKSFDYGISCYQSAFKAFESLLEDGHSGASIHLTKNILVRLIEGKPLQPITDEDFANKEESYPTSAMKEDGLKSHKQCPRMSSLFREETLDGVVTYNDVDRSHGIEINNPRDCYSSSMISNIVNELFPITMPYMPLSQKYKVYTDTFLVDEKNGDFDTRGLIYLITPQGERVELDIYNAEIDGEWVGISKEEFEERRLRAIINN